ncbi:hypothetical protein Tco_1144140 [Tanacetum coccineum]
MCLLVYALGIAQNVFGWKCPTEAVGSLRVKHQVVLSMYLLAVESLQGGNFYICQRRPEAMVYTYWSVLLGQIAYLKQIGNRAIEAAFGEVAACPQPISWQLLKQPSSAISVRPPQVKGNTRPNYLNTEIVVLSESKLADKE